ncbi:hypothetical protein Ntsu_53260 [Nocardia sp. IFM 10818]
MAATPSAAMARGLAKGNCAEPLALPDAEPLALPEADPLPEPVPEPVSAWDAPAHRAVTRVSAAVVVANDAQR